MKYYLLITCLLFSFSCTSVNQGGRLALPGDLTSGAREIKSKNRQEQPPAADAEEDPAEVVREIDERNERFNNRLREVMSQFDQEKQQVKGQAAVPKQGPVGEKLAIDLFDADLLDVIRLFMTVLEENYTIQPGVGGSVTLHIDDQFNREQTMDLLQGILRINGAAMVEKMGVWEIMPLSQVPAMLDGDQVILPEEGVRPVRGQVLQGFKLRFMAASELVNVLKPYLSPGALVYASDEEGVMLICDYPHSLSKVEKLVSLFDVSTFAGLNIRVHTLKYATAPELSSELEALSKATGLDTTKGNSGLTFLALDRLNMLAVMSKSKQVLDFADAWIEELDRQLPLALTTTQDESIFVYYVQNGDADEIVGSLEGIFEESKPEEQGNVQQGSVLPIGSQIEAAAAMAKTESGVGTVTGKLSGPVSFVVDTTTNSIITRANGKDYEKIKAVIERLDIYPKQCLIEVVIAEVRLNDSTKLGVEWQYLLNLNGSATGSVGVDSGLGVINPAGGALIGSGLSFLVAGERLTAALKAFASDSNVEILSSPHVLASNHQEAEINVGQEVPIVTSELRTTEASSTGTTVDKTIEYRDTGIILKVTPHINDKGLVRMEVSQEVSDIADTTVEGVNSPVFSNRTATTTLVVNSEQTVVIGGLIEHQRTRTNNGVPGFSKVPFLKYLFGYEEDSYEGSELLIFITPHVIENKEDVDFISRGFIERLEMIKDAFR